MTSSHPDTSHDRDYKIPALALGAVALSVIAGVAIAAPTHKVTRTIYRIPPACTAAAHEAATVVTHNQRLAGLIDFLQHPTSHRLVVGDNLPRYDRRVPDLEVCE